jgi:hypothetical protein
MTPPPTSMDGTDITGATIDGTEVSEITVDGDTVFTATAESLISLYEFEQDVTDSVGVNDGVNNGGVFTTNAEVGSFAIELEKNNNDHVRIPKDPSLDDVRSVFAYVFPQNLSNNNFGDTVYNDELANNNDKIRLIRMGLDGGLVSVNTLNGDSNVSFGQTFNNNQYYHLGFTFDTSGTLAGYVNGSQVGTDQAPSGDILQIDDGAAIGARISNTFGDSRFFPGIIDDVRLYDKALSPTEVSNLFNTGSI